MNRGFSIYLDAVRFLAALLVLLSHLAYPRFTGGSLQFLRDWDYGRDAVILFFVLSGLVIAYVVERDGNWKRYGFNRLTRLYSVVLPALLITFVLDRTGQAISPVGYDGWWYAPLSAGEFFLWGLTFSNEWLTGPVRLGTNGPLWSLSYEVAYYLLFGMALYLKGYRRILLVLITALIAGPRVLLLMPVWLSGVWVWRTTKRLDQASKRSTALLLAVMFPAMYIGASLSGLPPFLSSAGSQLFAGAFPSVTLAFSSAYLWNILMGAFFALHLVGMAQLLATARFSTLERPVRWLAGASFTLYVLHYPVLQFIDALLPASLPGRSALLLALVLMACFAVAEVTERRLKPLREALMKPGSGYVQKT